MSELSTVVAAQQNITIKRGDSFGPITLQFFTTDSNGETPINITGDTFIMKVAEKNCPTAILTFTMSSGLTVQNTNELVIERIAAEMVLAAGTYYYEIKRTQTSGTVTTEVMGDFKVINNIS